MTGGGRRTVPGSRSSELGMMGNLQPTDGDSSWPGLQMERTTIRADDGIRTRDPHLGNVEGTVR
jgi:hypothetical protein